MERVVGMKQKYYLADRCWIQLESGEYVESEILAVPVRPHENIDYCRNARMVLKTKPRQPWYVHDHVWFIGKHGVDEGRIDRLGPPIEVECGYDVLGDYHSVIKKPTHLFRTQHEAKRYLMTRRQK